MNVNHQPLRRFFGSREAWSWQMCREFFDRRLCLAHGCKHRGDPKECPDHGIGAYYDRHRKAGTDSGD